MLYTHTHTHTHTHTQYSYQKPWERICAVLSNEFFVRRILLGVAKIEYIDKVIAGIDWIAVNVCKKNIYGDEAYPFCVVT